MEKENENEADKVFGALFLIETYRPAFLKITGSASCGILLSQLYCCKKNNEGWFCKTNEDLCEETGLTIEALKTAKGKLVKLGLIKIERRGIPAKTWYLVDYNIMADKILKI